MDEKTLHERLIKIDERTRAARELAETQRREREAREALQKRGKKCSSEYGYIRHRYRKFSEALQAAGHVDDSSKQANSTLPVKLKAVEYPELGEGWMTATVRGLDRQNRNKKFDKAEVFEITFGFIGKNGTTTSEENVREMFTANGGMNGWCLQPEERWENEGQVKYAEELMTKRLPEASTTIEWLQTAAMNAELNPELAAAFNANPELKIWATIPPLSNEA